MWSIGEIVFEAVVLQKQLEMRMTSEGGDRKQQKAGSIAKERWKKRYRVEKKECSVPMATVFRKCQVKRTFFSDPLKV